MDKRILMFGLIAIFMSALASADAPTVTLLTPADDSWTNDTTTTHSFNVTGNLSNYSCVLWYNVSGALAPRANLSGATMNATTLMTANTTASELEIEWYVNCTGNVAANTTSSAIRTFTIDAIAPVVFINTSRYFYHTPAYTDDVNFGFNFTPNDTVSIYMNCSLYLNGVINSSNSSHPTVRNATNYTQQFVNVTGTPLPEGNYTWQINCTDNASNVGTSGVRVLFVDRTAPSSLTLNEPAHLATLDSTDVNFNWTVIDNVDNPLVCNISIGIDGNVYTGFGGISSSNNTKTNMTFTLQEGCHDWMVRCIDNVSLTINSSVRRFCVEISDPGWVTGTCSGPNGVIRWNRYLNSGTGGCCAIDEYFNEAYLVPPYWGCVPLSVGGGPVVTTTIGGGIIPSVDTSDPAWVFGAIVIVIILLGAYMNREELGLGGKKK